MANVIKYGSNIYRTNNQVFKFGTPEGPTAWFSSENVEIIDGRISKLIDISGKGNNLVSNLVSQRPIISTDYLDGKPAILFEGGQQLYSVDHSPFEIQDSDATFLWVGRSLDNGQLATFTKAALGESHYEYFVDQNLTYLRWSPGDNIHTNSSCVLNSPPAVYRVNSLQSTGSMNVYKNGTLNYARPMTEQIPGAFPFRVGAFQSSPTVDSGARFLQGIIAEFIFFKNVSESSIVQVEQDLLQKYQIT